MTTFCSGSNGSGALTQLIAQGALDTYLTANSNFTFWRTKYHKHSAFALESIGQPFQTQVAFGSEAQITLNRSGDLIYFMYVVIDLPAITACDGDAEQCVGISPVGQFPSCGAPCAPCVHLDRIRCPWAMPNLHLHRIASCGTSAILVTMKRAPRPS